MSTGYLLDSHVVLWYLVDEPRLSESARAIVDEPSNRVLVSDVTLYELTSKAMRARPPSPLLRLPDMLEASALTPTLPISGEALRTAATLDWSHGDPWDRVLLAQATLEDLMLVSKDAVFDAMGERRLW